MGATIVVQFGAAIERVLAGEIREVSSFSSSLRDRVLGDPSEAILRAQALAISSVNDQWGVSRDPGFNCSLTNCGFAGKSISSGPFDGSWLTTWAWARPSNAAWFSCRWSRRGGCGGSSSLLLPSSFRSGNFVSKTCSIFGFSATSPKQTLSVEIFGRRPLWLLRPFTP